MMYDVSLLHKFYGALLFVHKLKTANFIQMFGKIAIGVVYGNMHNLSISPNVLVLLLCHLWCAMQTRFLTTV